MTEPDAVAMREALTTGIGRRGGALAARLLAPLLSLTFGCVLALASRAATAGDPPPSGAPPAAAASDAAWEVEVEGETAAQDREIEAAMQGQSMGSVITRYANRVSRDGSALNHYLLGRALYHNPKNKDLVGAKAQMEAALQANPTFWPAHLKLAQLLIELKNEAQADAHLKAVLLAKPGHGDALKLSVTIAVEAKDWERALRLLDELIARFPADLSVRRNAASIHMERKDWDSAIRELRLLRGAEPGNLEYRRRIGFCLLQKGDLNAAQKELDELTRGGAPNLPALNLLLSVYMAKKDWPSAKSTLERMLPLLPADAQKTAITMIEELRSGAPHAPQAGEEPRPTLDDLFAKIVDPDPERRREALEILHEGIVAGYVREGPWRTVLERTHPAHEADWRCRAWAVKIAQYVLPSGLFFLSVAAYDPERDVRMLAIEEIGDVRRPAGIAYLLPLLGKTDDVAEFNTVRAALTALTGYRDLPLDVAVAAPADVLASRESWRRWRLSDASRDVKIEAIRDVIALREVAPERYLYQFVMDDTFDVMREAYVALRTAVLNPPMDEVQRKTYPRFPKFADADVTRVSMKTIQDRVAEWWQDWVAEHKALLRAAETPPDSTPSPAGPK